jgi:hypothetical protein
MAKNTDRTKRLNNQIKLSQFKKKVYNDHSKMDTSSTTNRETIKTSDYTYNDEKKKEGKISVEKEKSHSND